MAMTKKTVYTTTRELTENEKVGMRAKVAELVPDGATDGQLIFSVLGDTFVRERHWVDQDAAVAWQTWVTNYAAEHGFSWDSFEISDI